MFILRNAQLHTMAGSVIPNGYLAAANGKITAVGPMSECPAAGDGDSVLDAEGRWVLPGLVDAHCHLGVFGDGIGFEGDDGNEATDPVTPHLRAIDGIHHADRGFSEALAGGVTTVVTGPGSANVIGGQFAALKTAGRTVDEMAFKAPCAMKIAFGENPKTVYHEKHQTPITRMATAAMLREQLMKAREYGEAQKEYEQDTQENDKPEYDMKLEALLPVLRGELVVKAHAHRADDIATALRIRREFNLDMTIEHATEGWMMTDVLRESGIDVIIGPLLTDRSKVELRHQELGAAGILEAAGIAPAIMSDHPEVPVQHLLLCAAMAAREGMSEEGALRAVTSRAAEVCRIADRVGSLVPGKDADLIILSGHPFSFATRVDVTVIEARIVHLRDSVR
jgi:imidazolonepropionase-like amidohydrolase